MKNIHKYILLSVLAFALASCSEDEIVNGGGQAKPGEEVKFSLSLNKDSRTAYGDETNGTFPIYWVDGDKVQVHSPHASSSRNNAEYKVILPDGVAQPNYAKDLVKTGAYGVQWGDGYEVIVDGDEVKGFHDFYSIYPSGNYKFVLEGEGESKSMIAKGVKVALQQEVNYVDGKYIHDMSNCLMYAATPKVNMKDGVVNLSYEPFSTVLWFELTVDAQTTSQESQRQNFMITGISLESSANIAGSFDFDVSAGEFKSWQDNGGTDKIALKIFDKSGSQALSYTLNAGETIEFPIFIAPASGLDLSNIKITVNTDKGTFIKTLLKKDIDLALAPGKIHKVVLPTLNVKQEGWDVSTWMKYIPRNVYLSEISIPGSWNSLNTDSQGSSPSIETQYANGIRAFHLDTRYKRTGSWGSYTYNVLGTADAGNTTNVSGKKVMTDANNPAFEENLSEITGNVKSDEYMVLICTFAQDSYIADGNNWIEYISNACEKNSDVYDAKLLSPNTLVGDVLGKVIVIVNTEGEQTELPENSKCLFVNMPMTMSANDFSGVLDERESPIHKAKGTDVVETDISIYHTHAQTTKNQDAAYTGNGQNGDRGYVPSKGQRITEINNILDWSKNNYNNPADYGHDTWIYLGVGGYYASYSSGIVGIGSGWKADSSDAAAANKSVAADFNTLINNRVTAMGSNGLHYYPVGIVLMNYVNDYKDAAIKNILLLNNKYQLQYDSSKPIDYKPSGTTDSGTTVKPGI